MFLTFEIVRHQMEIDRLNEVNTMTGVLLSVVVIVDIEEEVDTNNFLN